MHKSIILQPEEIRENLKDAGCTDQETECIVNCLSDNDTLQAQKLIETCRKKCLDSIHENQKNIDRLDYLSYTLHMD